MNKIKLIFLAASTFLALITTPVHAYESTMGPAGLLKYDNTKTYEGYTLYAPNFSTTTYLIDMKGNIVHKWTSSLRPGTQAELLENGNLLRAGKLNPAQVGNPLNAWGGTGGVVQEIDWNGNVVWQYQEANPTAISHHAFHRMPNGNTLVLVWEFHSKAEALAKGRDPNTVLGPGDPGYQANLNGIWSEKIVEVNGAGNVVWEWHAWDHIGTGQYELDINYRLPLPMTNWRGNADWMHSNAVEYIPEKDYVVLESPSFSEFYFIDHQTGKIVYRWGNACAYHAGACPSYMNDGDQLLFGPHGVFYINAGLQGAGNILIFDNGWMRPSGSYSRVLEVNTTTNQVVWQYATNALQSFDNQYQGYAQRLPNGNTLITSSLQGHVIEVTPSKEIVWEFVNPIFSDTSSGKDSVYCWSKDQLTNAGGGGTNMMFRAYRYGPNYPGLIGKNLANIVPLTPNCPAWTWFSK